MTRARTTDGCKVCGSQQSLERHHIVSRAEFGCDCPANIALLCEDCHEDITCGRAPNVKGGCDVCHRRRIKIIQQYNTAQAIAREMIERKQKGELFTDKQIEEIVQKVEDAAKAMRKEKLDKVDAVRYLLGVNRDNALPYFVNQLGV